MLMLRIYEDERIMIGDDIEILMAEVGSRRATLGIIAPREIPILRPGAKCTVPRDRAGGE